MRHEKLKLTVPWESLDLVAQQQIQTVLAMPELERLAIMPDVHAGNGMCIGGVALLHGLVSPFFVGTDIGCGMCHVNVGLTLAEIGLVRQKDRERFFKILQEYVPCERHKIPTDREFPVFVSASGDKRLTAAIQQITLEQFGTLGSGNHFLELGENSNGMLGITIHSGSRRPGFAIAEWYMAHGRFFATDSDIGKAYLADMQWAMNFAALNRRAMMKATLQAKSFSQDTIGIMLVSDG